MGRHSPENRNDGLISVIDENDKFYVDSSWGGSTLSRSPSTHAPETSSGSKLEFYSAPETSYDSDKQLHTSKIDGSGLELNDFGTRERFDEKEWHDPGNGNAARPWKQRFSTRRARIILVLMAVAIVGLVVGLGVGLTRRNALDANSPTSSTNLVLEETSLAATITSEGNRHVFYQGTEGDILPSQLNVGSKNWLYNNMSQIMTGDPARISSPLAASLSEGLADSVSTTGTFNQSILLLYVNKQQSLVARSYQPGGHVSDNLFNTSLPVKKDSRVVKMTQLSVVTNFTTEVIIAYESANDGFRILHAYYYVNMSIALGNSGYKPIWYYTDITRSIFEAQYKINSTSNDTIPSGTTIFDCSHVGGYSNPAILLGFLNLAQTSVSAVPPPLFVGQYERWRNNPTPNITEFAFDSTITTASSLPNLGIGDTALLTWRTGGQGVNTTYTTQPVWINQQRLHNFLPALDIPFPYPRIGWTSSNVTTSLYVYNQINGTALVESQFVDGIQWASQYIVPSK